MPAVLSSSSSLRTRAISRTSYLTSKMAGYLSQYSSREIPSNPGLFLYSFLYVLPNILFISKCTRPSGKQRNGSALTPTALSSQADSGSFLIFLNQPLRFLLLLFFFFFFNLFLPCGEDDRLPPSLPSPSCRFWRALPRREPRRRMLMSVV